MSNIIFLGPPGAGKGTQAQLLAKELGIPQISTGEILRKAMREGTKTGLEAKRYVESGALVPDDVVIAIVRERLQEKDCANGYMLDGFPRTVYQAEELGKFAKIDVAIELQLADEIIIDRLSGRRVCPKCGATYHLSLLKNGEICENDGEKLIQRPDDSEETIRNRLKVYQEQTAPLINYYRDLGLLKPINCEDSVEENFRKVLKAVKG